MWLAKLAGWGMLRPSFVPPPQIRQLRDYTRLRTDLTRERARHWQRLEKLLEDALIKITTVASRTGTMSVRDMTEAMIAGERDPRRLAGLARGRMKAKRAALIEALTGRFDDHHGQLAAILLAQIDGLTAQIEQLTTRIDQLITAIPAAQGADPDGTTGPQAGRGPDAPVLPAISRLAEIPGISRHAAQVIIAETGLDMTRFPTAAHLVSWARLCPRTIQSGNRTQPGRTAKGNPYLKGALGDAAAAAGKTDTFLGERYRRLVRRRGKLKPWSPSRAPSWDGFVMPGWLSGMQDDLRLCGGGADRKMPQPGARQRAWAGASAGWSGGGGEGDGVAEGFELADVAAYLAVGVDGGDVEVGAEVVVAGGAVGEQVPDDDLNCPCPTRAPCACIERGLGLAGDRVQARARCRSSVECR